MIYRILAGMLGKRKQAQTIKAERLLIINLQGMGDILMTTPLIHELQRNGKEVDVLTTKNGRQALKDNKDVAHIIAFETPWQALKEVNKQHYDLIYLAYGAGPKSGLFFSCLKAKHKACHLYDMDGKMTSFRADITIKQTPSMHRVDEHLKLLTRIGCKQPRKTNYQYVLNTKDRSFAKTYLKKQFQEKKLIVIHPGGDKHNTEKRYPIDHYLDVARQLSAAYATLFILGPDEKDLKEKLQGQATFTGTIGQAAAIIASSEVLIHSDSFLGHLAAAVGTKTITIAGATNWPRTRPYGEKDYILKARGSKKPRERRMEEGNIEKQDVVWPSSEAILKEISP